MKAFYREPAVTLGAVGATAQIVTSYGFGVDAQLQSIITAVLAAVFGLYTAYKAGDGIHAAVLGLLQAGMSLFTYYGLDWSAEQQGRVLAVVMALVSLWVRDRVTAPVGPEVSPPGKLIA